MELYWYIIVIIFIIIKIFFYVCWYRSRQRQLDAYLSNPRNAQIVIVGGRAYLHQLCEQRQNVTDDLKPPPYSELTPEPHDQDSQFLNMTDNYEVSSLNEAPPPYTPAIVIEEMTAPPYHQSNTSTHTCGSQNAGP
ncbi:hypothetical protein GDO78_012818 [Eleutherodactylus coqui]|uniref:Uncharacterized protein n=1 Tax=Eleutherodactylus coqui TaxID=57060 RepID=A0A8J6F1H7_ELECQ|nr:hypothetical protein GDO78_012818 [Eleutherodactylus coqui]